MSFSSTQNCSSFSSACCFQSRLILDPAGPSGFLKQAKKSEKQQPMKSQSLGLQALEAVRDFTFVGSMITADGDSSHEIKRRLLLGRKAMTNLDSILNSRDITLPTKVRIVKAMVFPVVMYGSESWTIKKADH
uniref:Uncharacterized protein n=1 Tax=Podarcis muralis TaxID=64176 RepID=A0A670K8E6_PODMU